MTPPLASVIVPAYNQARYLGEAIQSVLAQTYPNFELIVVDDASPDQTTEIVAQFDDSRIRSIAHEANRGLAAARNTAMRASIGQILFLLDADDAFHPKKLEAHIHFLAERPEIGVTYNARKEMDSDGAYLNIWRPPATAVLADLVMGFPFAPSDMVLRREWAFRVNLFDESYIHFSEDLDINCRLGLAGCHFACVDQVLNYRRYYPGRIIKNVRDRFSAACRALETAFNHPDCPEEVSAKRSLALSATHVVWSYEAFILQDTAVGQEILKEAIRLDPSIIADSGKRLLEFLTYRSIRDGSDHEIFLNTVFSQLPAEVSWLQSSRDRYIAEGYLQRSARSVINRELDDARIQFRRAKTLGAAINGQFFEYIANQLRNLELVMPIQQIEEIVQDLSLLLGENGGESDARMFKGVYEITRAFSRFHAGRYNSVFIPLLRAVKYNPQYLTNRGVISILIRSILAIANR